MLRTAVIQMVSTDNVGNNLVTAERLIGQAAGEKARFLVLPENFPLMGMEEHDKVRILEDYGKGPLQDFLKEQARKHEVWLLGGTIPLRASVPDKIRATSLLFSPDGECMASYDKIHLFDVHIDSGGDENYNESGTIEAGDKVAVVKTSIGNIGLSVCYDVRFPELYRCMHTDDVNIIAVPSAFTATTGRAHWESLLRARAVENLCYVVAPNQGGHHANDRITWGHSMIMNPWGEIMAIVENGEGVACADIDLEQLKKLRSSFPVLQHRKLDIKTT